MWRRLGAKGDVELPVRLVEPLGKDTLLYFDAGAERAFVAVSEGLGMAEIKVGERVALSLDQRRHPSVRCRRRADRRASLTPPTLKCEPSIEEPMDYREKSEIRDGMRIDWDMPIKMDDGLVLRCDIYRPIAEGKYPVIMTLGPYGKWLHFEDLYKNQWERMCADQPDVPTDSTNKYQCWEVVDPEKWVPDGYVCIRVDSRGAGRSPGVIDIWSLREAQDLAICVDWAGVQPWSNGKVGLNGISYYGQNQWQTAALQPKHLAAICIWEGAADFYRDMAHHGGIFNRGFVQDWSKAQVYSRAERSRQPRLQEPHERRLGVGTGDAVGRAARPQSPRFL